MRPKLDYRVIQGRAERSHGATVRLTAFGREMLLDLLAAVDRTYWRQPDADQNADFIKAQIDGTLGALMRNIFIGMVMWGAWEDTPPGTLICDGDIYLKAEYPLLAEVLGSAYSIDSESFRVPDLIEKFARGDYAAGLVGGEDRVTLTEAQLPSHAHGLNLINGLVVGPGEVPVVVPSLIQMGATNYTGWNESHNNVPRYETLLPVIIAE